MFLGFEPTKDLMLWAIFHYDQAFFLKKKTKLGIVLFIVKEMLEIVSYISKKIYSASVVLLKTNVILPTELTF